MKVLGIVAEYNPFHNGHSYHLEESIKITGATHSVAVMSGSFMQRGDLSIVNKWARAEMAVKAGVDLVLELPVVYACRSAEAFAMGAVNLLNGIGVVDCISFGSESGSLSQLQRVSDVLAEEPEVFKHQLRYFLSKGLSFPSARALALEKCPGNPSHGFSKLLASPNNILAVEYLKALKRLKSGIYPVTVKRYASSYHSSSIINKVASASAIRSHLLKTGVVTARVSRAMPETTLGILRREFAMGRGPVCSDILDLPVISGIRKLGARDLKKFPEVAEGLENRIYRAARENATIPDLLLQAKTKRYTHTRLRRITAYIALDIHRNMLERLEHFGYPCYARVLALNTRGREILKEANTRSRIPVITKTSNHGFEKNSPFINMLRKDILSTDLYVLGYSNGDFAFAGQDFVTSPVYL